MFRGKNVHDQNCYTVSIPGILQQFKKMRRRQSLPAQGPGRGGGCVDYMSWGRALFTDTIMQKDKEAYEACKATRLI